MAEQSSYGWSAVLGILRGFEVQKPPLLEVYYPEDWDCGEW